ncbi:hypothetical protein Tamer19_08420 [Cupriavidus sp. TA19]|nr:hypothetical protein Tamer19_08420 [Cupriavidus sp. TA19]
MGIESRCAWGSDASDSADWEFRFAPEWAMDAIAWDRRLTLGGAGDAWRPVARTCLLCRAKGSERSD